MCICYVILCTNTFHIITNKTLTCSCTIVSNSLQSALLNGCRGNSKGVIIVLLLLVLLLNSCKINNNIINMYLDLHVHYTPGYHLALKKIPKISVSLIVLFLSNKHYLSLNEGIVHFSLLSLP